MDKHPWMVKIRKELGIDEPIEENLSTNENKED